MQFLFTSSVPSGTNAFTRYICQLVPLVADTNNYTNSADVGVCLAVIFQVLLCAGVTFLRHARISDEVMMRR